MRSFPVDFLIISAGALGATNGERADGESLAKVAALRRTGIECLIVREDEQPDIGLMLAEIGCRTVRERTISIGCSRWDLGLAAASALHFHVGAAHDVSGKVAGLVPLSGQGLCGTNNVLD